MTWLQENAMQTKIILEESDIPTHWYNVVADMPNPPPPPLGPDGQPIGPEALAPIFPMALIEQEVSAERWLPIPERVREALQLWRPSPLYRAHRLEQMLGTPAKIYYKYEGVSPAGSHKPNSAVAQAYYNHEAGIRRLATEPGLASGARPWPLPDRCSASTYASTWSRSATNRSRSGAR
jgi:tryptophan synthase beta chain